MHVEPVSGRVIGGPYEPVYVYEAPVRVWHWVTMLAIYVLGATGYLIGSPPPAIGGEAVHVPYAITWVHEHVDVPPEQQGRYHELEHIGQLPALLERLEH